jgi:hypothetical protein
MVKNVTRLKGWIELSELDVDHAGEAANSHFNDVTFLTFLTASFP